MRVGPFLLGWLLAILVSSAHCSQEVAPAIAVGLAQCSDCLENKIQPAHAFTGLTVNIDCKNEKGELSTRAQGHFDKDGKFGVDLPKELLKPKGSGLNQECFARIQGADNKPCPSAASPESHKLIYKALQNGKHTFTTKGSLAFSPLICTSATFWCIHPWFKNHPWCQSPWFNKPPLPQFPPFPTFPPKTYFPFPPKVYFPPPTETPPVYETPPTPTPVYTPPTPTPVYTPPTPTPVYKPPTPIYKPPTPVYKPPTPVYKPPTPVYKPPTPVYKPPTPVYKPPVYVKPPTPVYKPPKKPCPPVFNKPFPPIPHFPPKIIIPPPVYGTPVPIIPHFPPKPWYPPYHGSHPTPPYSEEKHQ
ncbi:Proline-rich protein 2 [Nymphaea thermarum]|nr:Proline-rich protein 2 [Nymphaea thermarum]